MIEIGRLTNVLIDLPDSLNNYGALSKAFAV